MLYLIPGSIKFIFTFLAICFSATGQINSQETLKTFIHEGRELQAYPTDHGTRVPWGRPNDASGATSANNGNVNTQTITGKYGNWYQGNYAARACADLNAFGYSDWYLPSRGELQSLYRSHNEIGGFSNALYWSSTDDTWGAEAFAVNFSAGTGFSLARYKNQLHRVRCIRVKTEDQVQETETDDDDLTQIDAVESDDAEFMSPIVISSRNLPFFLEGYTIVENGDGTGYQLYNQYSSRQAKNVYYNGGISIDIEGLFRPLELDPQRPPDVIDHHEPRMQRTGNLKAGRAYQLTLRVSPGNRFAEGKRTPTEIEGPTSQVIMHFPSSVTLISDPVVRIDGRTQAQQLTNNLLSIASLGMPTGDLGAVMGSMIIGAIDKIAREFLVDKTYQDYKPSEKIEIHSELELGRANEISQIAWVLGGHRLRDISTAKSAEIILYLHFKEEGNYDLSLFFNLWNRHSYVDRSDLVTMSLGDYFLHSFRQHVVISVEVEDDKEADEVAEEKESKEVVQEQERGTSMDPRDGRTYKTVNSECIIKGADGFTYTLTKNAYNTDHDNLEQAVRAEFGKDAVIADWNDIKNNFGNNIASFLNNICIYSDGETTSATVTRNGRKFFSGNRYYFIRRFEGIVRSGWLVHDHIQNRTLCLGSWSGTRKILVKYPNR